MTDSTGPVHYLNEFEYIKGQIFANVWQTDRIARIDPKSGKITGWINLAGILPQTDRLHHRGGVLNNSKRLRERGGRYDVICLKCVIGI